MEDKNKVIGFVLLGILMMAYFFFTNQKRVAAIEEQRIKDSIENARIVPEQRLLDTTSIVLNDTTKTTIDTLQLKQQEDMRMVIKYGDFAISASGEEKDYVLENEFVKFTFSNKGGKIKQTQLKNYKKSIYVDKEKVESELFLLDDAKNRFAYKIPVNGVANPISTEDLIFKAVESSSSKVVFRAFAGSPDRYFEQSYAINGDYTLDYNISFVGLGGTLASNTSDIELEWVNYLDRIEKSTDYESSLSTAYYKVSNDDPSYCSCRGDDEVTKKKPIDWVAHTNQFFNTTIMANGNPFSSMYSEVKAMDAEDQNLKMLQTNLNIPYNNNFKMTIYSGPNEFKRLAAFENDMEDIIPYGRSILGTINRWVIRPLFTFFSGFISNMGIVIILVTLLVKMVLFPLTYKMLYSQSKMAALKTQIEAIKKKIGDDQQAVQVETMKLYRETGVNPLGGCMPMVIQMPIWIALYRFFPASIEFRQASFLWADDLASYDVFTWLPFDIPFYGAHVSLFTILWAITTVIYTYYNSKHMDMSANPAMKYMQYFMPLIFLFFFNSMAAGLTCYMLFSNLINITQTLVTKNIIIDKKKVAAEIENYKTKPKKEGGFRDRLSKAFEEAQKAQEGRQKDDKKKKK